MISIIGVIYMVGVRNSADVHMINTVAANCGGLSDNLCETPFFQHDSQAILGVFVVVKIEIPTYNSWFSQGGIEERVDHPNKLHITMREVSVWRSVHCEHINSW